MIRTAARKSTFLAVAVLSMGTAAVGCNKSTSGQDNKSNGGHDDVGSASFELRVPGVQVDTFHWSLTKGAPPAIVKEGDHMVPQTGPSAAFLVTGLLPGAYNVNLSGDALPNPVNPDPVHCSGTGTFTIVPGMTAHTTVILNCVQTATQGGVAVETTVQFEDCPQITSYLVSSTQPGLGGVVDVTSTASDRDPSLALTFAWSATAPGGSAVGVFANPAAATTQFTCPAGYNGEQTLTLYVTNGVSKMPQACPLAKESILVLCVPTNCGDGVVQAHLGEACDNGLSPSGARLNGPGTGCSYSCTSDTCGNGMLDAGEACDNGTANGPGNRCNLACQVTPICGDGTRDLPEGCDDGNTISGDGCSSTCVSVPAVCGNGLLETFGGETCDDGNTINGDGCSSTCQGAPAVCGNGMLETFGGEACDDGNTVNGDGCESNCQPTPVVCGNGILQSGEACDDGNTTNLDGCSSTCRVETACFLCEESHRADGTCESLMGCANLTVAADKALCETLLNCMYSNPSCWASDPAFCFGGACVGSECATNPMGVCKDQARDAAKTTSYTDAGIRFYDLDFPSGHASQQIVCDLTQCSGVACP